jgi:uncharacterized small protein (DUF1192 family)
MPQIDDRIEALGAKLKQLKARQRRKETRARTIASRRPRHQGLRRKILAWAVLLAKVEAGEFDEAVLRKRMDTALGRAEDLELFGLGESLELFAARSVPE